MLSREKDHVRTAENLSCVCFGDIPCSFDLDIENYSDHFPFYALLLSMVFCLFSFSVLYIIVFLLLFGGVMGSLWKGMQVSSIPWITAFQS